LASLTASLQSANHPVTERRVAYSRADAQPFLSLVDDPRFGGFLFFHPRRSPARMAIDRDLRTLRRAQHAHPIGREFFEKTAGLVGLEVAEDPAPLRMRKVESRHRARHPHVTQAALFFDVAVARSGMRE